jgi:hypothetical protein
MTSDAGGEGHEVSRNRNQFNRPSKREEGGGKEHHGGSNEIEIDIASHGERPSVRAKLNKVAKASIADRPRIPADSPCMYRVYLTTVQRISLDLPQLNSAAAYLLICDDENTVVLWVGQTCTDKDIKFAKEIGLEVLRRDLRNYELTGIDLVIWEGKEGNDSKLLDYFLDKFDCDASTYRGKKVLAERKKPIKNQPISICVMEKLPDFEFELVEVGYAAHDDHGKIDRIPFAPVESNSIVVLNVGDQWDIWIARGNTIAEESSAKRKITSLVMTQLECDRSVANTKIRFSYQGCERVMFRRHFKVLTYSLLS